MPNTVLLICSPTDIILLGRSNSAIEKCKSRPNLPERSKECTGETQKNLPQLAAGSETRFQVGWHSKSGRRRRIRLQALASQERERDYNALASQQV